MNPVTGTGRTL